VPWLKDTIEKKDWYWDWYVWYNNGGWRKDIRVYFLYYWT